MVDEEVRENIHLRTPSLTPRTPVGTIREGDLHGTVAKDALGVRGRWVNAPVNEPSMSLIALDTATSSQPVLLFKRAMTHSPASIHIVIPDITMRAEPAGQTMFLSNQSPEKNPSQAISRCGPKNP